MVEQELDNMLNEFDQQLRAQGMDIQTYFQYIGKDPADFRTEMRDEAFKKTKTRMIVTWIAEHEDFEVTEEEVSQEIENMASQYGLEKEKLVEMLGEDNLGMIKGDLKVRKAVDYMYDNAVIE